MDDYLFSIKKYVERRIARLGHIQGTSLGNATFANLRRGAGRKPGEVPTALNFVLNGLSEAVNDYPDTPRESVTINAVYMALTLYALHQRGYERSMHARNVSLGKAVARLARAEGDKNAKEKAVKRIQVLTESRRPEILSYHLRQLVSMMNRSKSPVSMDYGLLATDIAEILRGKDTDQVYLRWSRDFFRELNYQERKGA